MIKVKGHEFKKITIRDSYNRRALQYKNKIINDLKVFRLTEDDIDVPLESIAMKKAQSSVSWYMWDEHMFFSYNRASKFVENLAMVSQIIEHFINLLSESQISQEEFIDLFAEDKDIIKQRIDAREVLGVDQDSTDFKTIHKNFKKLSKEHHPDMPEGDTEKFKKINKAHKILKKELH